jgi:hypothetical protein
MYTPDTEQWNRIRKISHKTFKPAVNLLYLQNTFCDLFYGSHYSLKWLDERLTMDQEGRWQRYYTNICTDGLESLNKRVSVSQIQAQ